MQATLHKRHKVVIILLSLLINLLLILPLILMKLDQINQEAFVIFQQEPEKQVTQQQSHPEPEELIECILSSGAVAASSEQEFQEDMAPQENPMLTHAQPGAQLEEEIEQESKIEQTTPEEQTVQESEPIQEQEAETEITESELVEKQPKEHLPAQPETAMSLQEVAEQTIVEEKKPEPVIEKPKVEVKKEERELITKPKPLPKPEPKKEQAFGVSLGQITQGFLKSVQQEEGLNNPPHMDADKLAAHQYATIVWNIIKDSFRSDPNMLHLSQNIDTMAYLVITLTKKGKLIDIHLEGNKINSAFRQIEAMITSHAKNSGLFPPLPKRFNVPQKTFTFPLHIQGHEGFHSYRLSYGPNK